MNKQELQEDQTRTKRFTKQRQAILETLRTAYHHPDANWIYKKVSKKIPNISLGTVYRNLNILVEENLVKEISIKPNVTNYEANTMTHHHAYCTECHKIEDIEKEFECDLEKNVKEKFSQKLNYKDLSCNLIFTGICPECQKKLYI